MNRNEVARQPLTARDSIHYTAKVRFRLLAPMMVCCCASAPVIGACGRTAITGPVVRFIAVGDTGKGNAAQFAVGRQMASLCARRGCDFVAFLGDNFYPSGVSSADDPLWQSAFRAPYAELLDAGVPIYGVLGNHDYGGSGAGWEPSKAEAQLSYSELDAGFVMPSSHYRFRFRHAEFFAADTNRSMFGFDQAVRSDLATWLPASTATWKLAFGHHPYRSNGPHGNAGVYEGVPGIPLVSGDGMKRFFESSVCGKADMYLSGHDHSLQWLTDTCAGTQLVVSGTGATGTSLPGSNPVHFSSLNEGFFYVVLEGRRFTGTFYDANGTTLFERSFSKD